MIPMNSDNFKDPRPYCFPHSSMKPVMVVSFVASSHQTLFSDNWDGDHSSCERYSDDWRHVYLLL